MKIVHHCHHHVILLSILVIFIIVGGCSDNKKIDYQLQEQCSKKCDEIFRKDYGNGNLTDSISDITLIFQNHYNKKMNRCFMLVSSTARYHNKMTNPLSMKTLEDVTEHKEYGNFAIFDKQYTPSTCDFLGKHCSSEEEWDLLAKPYMEE